MLQTRPHATSTHRRTGAALWCAGLAAFSLMYAPQGLLTLIARDTQLDASRVSLLVSATTFGLAVAVLPWAWLSDRIGRRDAMRLAAASAAVTAVIVPWLPTFEAMLAGRFVQGAALGGIPALAVAVVHETVAPEKTAAMASRYVAATSLGGLAGRVVVAPIAEYVGWRWALMLLGIVVVALMAILIAVLPATETVVEKGSSLRAVLRHLRDPRLVALFCVGGALMGGMVAVYNYLPFRLEGAPFSLAPTVVSLIFLAYLAGTAGSRIAGWLADRFGNTAVLLAASALLAIGAGLTLVSHIVVIAIGLIALTAGLFIGHALASNLVGKHAVHGRAQATALYNISYYTGSSVFGWLGGVMWLTTEWKGVVALVVLLAGVAAVMAYRGAGVTSRSVPS
jgi:MFS transporter, YNFM family, putative membrane transport protein